MNPPEEILTLLRKEDNFLLLTHSTPDGDAFGSSLALKFLLEQLNKKVEVYTEQPIPLQYRFLPGIDLIKDLNQLSCKEFNVIVLIDCNKIKRVSNDRKILDKLESFRGLKIVIDHHIPEEDVNDSSIKWINSDKAATGVLIYYLLKPLDCKINREIAINLYTAIIVDTGNFQFDNTNEEVLFIAAELVKAGANPADIYIKCFESWNENRFRLFIRMLNNLQIISSLAISHISKSDFQETDTVESDTERFVEFLRILNRVNITALFREIDKGIVKASLRSKGNIDVSIIARDFGGGGHKNAAGYRIKGSIEDAYSGLKDKLKQYKLL